MSLLQVKWFYKREFHSLLTHTFAYTLGIPYSSITNRINFKVDISKVSFSFYDKYTKLLNIGFTSKL